MWQDFLPMTDYTTLKSERQPLDLNLKRGIIYIEDTEVEMYIKLKSVKFKNLLSYGNSISEFYFEEGMSLITAKNGSGKCVRGNTKCEIDFKDGETKEKFIKFLNTYQDHS